MAHSMETRSVPHSVVRLRAQQQEDMIRGENGKIRQQVCSLKIEDAYRYGLAKVEPMGRCFSEQEPSSPMRILCRRQEKAKLLNNEAF